jgi:hypothetical protein
LYDIVIKTNNGEINFDVAIKTLTGNVHGAGELTAMHVMAVLTLTGNCINRDFLRRATLSESCKKQVTARMFPNFVVKPSQMKRALNGVVRRLGLSEFIMENLLCESVRQKQGFDTFHPSQSITYLEEDTNNILCVSGGEIMLRTVEDDRRMLAELPEKDGVVPLFPWWQAKLGMDGIHVWFLELCKEVSVDPELIVVRPHLNSGKLSSEVEVWNKYIKRLQVWGKGKKDIAKITKITVQERVHGKDTATNLLDVKRKDPAKPDTNKPKKKKRRRQGRIVKK